MAGSKPCLSRGVQREAAGKLRGWASADVAAVHRLRSSPQQEAGCTRLLRALPERATERAASRLARARQKPGAFDRI